MTASLAGTDLDLFAAELLTSELATNVVEHAHSPFEVRVDRDDHHVRVEVVNEEPASAVEIREPDDLGGRGLRIVDSLARAWGTTVEGSSTLVWFELDDASRCGRTRA